MKFYGARQSKDNQGGRLWGVSGSDEGQGLCPGEKDGEVAVISQVIAEFVTNSRL
jgi:hypothetical protein